MGMQFGMDSGLRMYDPFAKNDRESQFNNPYQLPYKNIDLKPQPTNPLNPPAQAPSEETKTDPIFKSSLSNLRNMDSPDRQRYREFLQDIPRRSDHQLNKLGKALAVISGTAEGYVSKDVGKGVNTGLQMLDRPYEQALGDYTTKGSGLKELAGIEYQNQQDSKDLEVKIAKDQMDRRKQWFDELKGRKDMDKTDQEIEESIKRMEGMNLRLERGTKTGELYVVNTVTGEKKSYGQFDETAAEKDKRDYGYWLNKEGIQQAGRKELQSDLFRHQDAFQAAGAANDKGLAAYRAALDNLKPEVKDKAWQAAYDRVLTENPELKNSLFIEGKDDKGQPNGKLILKDAPILDAKGNPTNEDKYGNRTDVYNPEIYHQFIEAVNQKTKESLGLPAFDLKGYNDKTQIDPQRQSAVDRIMQYNSDPGHQQDQIEMTQENIDLMMRKQDEESRQFGQNPDLTVKPPLVNLPDYSLQLNPMVGNQGFEYQNLGRRPQQFPNQTGWWRKGQAGARF